MIKIIKHRKICLKTFIYIIIFMVTTIFCLPNTNANQDASDNHIFDIKKIQLEEVKSNITIIDENVWVVYDKTYFKQFDIKLDGNVISYFILNDDLYITLKNNSRYSLQKINLSTKEVFIENLNGDINDMVYHNNLIYLVGSVRGDAVIYIYNIKMNCISQHTYGGDNYEAFKKIKIINNSIYLFGIKNGISKNSEFSNTGSEDDFKSFIATIDTDMMLDKVLYINEQQDYEDITSIIVTSDKLYIILTTGDFKFYQYVLNFELNVLEKYSLNLCEEIQCINLVETPNINNEKVYIAICEDKLNLMIFSNKLEYMYTLDESTRELYYSQIKEGKLNIYYTSNGIINNMEVLEYHKIYSYMKEVYYQDSNYDSTNHFLVESYFQNLIFEYDESLNSHIQLNNSQVTTAYYTANTISNETITIQTPYKINSYINIINNGVYSKGYHLYFSDNVFLDNKQVYNGDVIDTVGYHKVVQVIGDDDENSNVYNIYIGENYNKSLDMNYLDGTIELNKDELYYYKLRLSANKQVNKVLVNNESYPFIQNQDEVILTFRGLNYRVINSYFIEKIIFEDDTQLLINEELKIKTKKQLPDIDVYYQNNKVIYNIDDPDFSIIDLKIKYCHDNNIIKEDMTYLKKYTIELFSELTKIEVILLYEDNTNEVKEAVIFELEGYAKNNKQICTIEYDITNTVNEIIFDNFDSKQNTILTSNIATTSVNSLFIDNTNYIYLWIIVISTALIGTITVIIFIYKKHKK